MNRMRLVFFHLLLVLVLLSGCTKKQNVPTVSLGGPQPADVLAPAAPVFQYVDYYVSVLGDDASGNGSPQKPWRHIQYAIDHAPAAGEGHIVRIILLKGIYEENLLIDHPLVIHGAGTGKASTWPLNPVLPNEEVSTISRQFDGSADPAPGIVIKDAGTVLFENLNVWGGGLSVTRTDFRMQKVEIQHALGLFGVHLVDCPWFQIDSSKIQTAPNVRSDYAIFIEGSSGEIDNTVMGDLFDHTINIVPTAPGDVIMPGQTFFPPSILIRNSQIAGSNIFYADGIRIQGPTNVEIYNTQVTRTHPDNEPAKNTYTVPHAGIEVAGWVATGDALVQIANVTVSGFDVGLGLVMEGYDIKVQDSNISGVTYDVWIAYNGYTNVSFPHIDLGGGFFNSKGHNVFGADSPYGVFHQGPYKVDACWNDWGVALTDVDPQRIHDQLDDSALGRVRWDCGLSVNNNVTRKVTVIQDSLCYAGPGEAYGVVSSLDGDQSLPLLGRSQNSQYFVVVNPLFQDACWLPVGSGEYGGSLPELTVLSDPGLPTPTPTPGSGPSLPARVTPTPGR